MTSPTSLLVGFKRRGYGHLFFLAEPLYTLFFETCLFQKVELTLSPFLT